MNLVCLGVRNSNLQVRFGQTRNVNEQLVGIFSLNHIIRQAGLSVGVGIAAGGGLVGIAAAAIVVIPAVSLCCLPGFGHIVHEILWYRQKLQGGTGEW